MALYFGLLAYPRKRGLLFTTQLPRKICDREIMPFSSAPLARLGSLALITSAPAVMGACSGPMAASSQEGLEQPVSPPQIHGRPISLCYRERLHEVVKDSFIGGERACVTGDIAQLSEHIDLGLYLQRFRTTANGKIDILFGANKELYHYAADSGPVYYTYLGICRYFECQVNDNKAPDCFTGAVDPISITANGQTLPFNHCEIIDAN